MLYCNIALSCAVLVEYKFHSVTSSDSMDGVASPLHRRNGTEFHTYTHILAKLPAEVLLNINYIVNAVMARKHRSDFDWDMLPKVGEGCVLHHMRTCFLGCFSDQIGLFYHICLVANILI